MTHFIIAYYISLVNVQTNYYNNNLLILDVKQLNKIIKLYYFYTLKALSDGQGRINTLSTNFTKWSNTLKQFVENLPTNCLSVFDHFLGLALKGLRCIMGCLGLKSSYREKVYFNFGEHFC